MAKFCFFTVLALLISSSLVAAEIDHHGHPPDHYEHIEILGKSVSHSELFEKAPAVTSLYGDKLFEKSEVSLGETLRTEPGVSSTQFGPHASRPVIRGLGGDRIRILQNGIGVLDASGASEDHSVPMSPMLVDSIEVVRGPISLLYGASAIGGVVNITNSRIHRHFDPGVYGGLDLKGQTANRGQSYAGKLDYGVRQWMFHMDGDYGKTENQILPGDRGEILNSDNEQHSVAVGVTRFTENDDNFGLSVSQMKNEYGVVAEEDVRIQMEQTRVDASGRIWLDGFFEDLRLQSAQSFYKHSELEGEEVGTRFENTGNETRLELHQKATEDLDGLLGLQWSQFDFSAKGEEAFLPATKNQSGAFFAFEELKIGKFTNTAGARGEWSEVQAESSLEKDFFTTSAALSSVYTTEKKWSWGSQLSYNQRAPNFQELFADGAHIATATFEVGDPNIDPEKSLALELSLRKRTKDFQGALTLYSHRFDDFISLTPDGTVDDSDDSGVAGDSDEDLPIFNYQNRDAEFYGAELFLEQKVNTGFGLTQLSFTMDWLRGRESDTGFSLPRISPLRLFANWRHQWSKKIESRFGLEQVAEQNRLAPNETSVPSYLFVNLGLTYKLAVGNHPWSLFLDGKNIFDQEGQNHVSLLKDRMWLPGRNLRAGIRGYF